MNETVQQASALSESVIEGDNPSANYPVLADRVQSTFIDMVLIIASMFPIAAALENISEPPDWIRIALFFALFGIYEPICTTLGCTVGNYVKGIQVRQASDAGKRINFLQGFVRYIFKVLLGWVSFITIHLNDERRAIHDYASGSIMIKAKKN